MVKEVERYGTKDVVFDQELLRQRSNLSNYYETQILFQLIYIYETQIIKI